MKKLILLAYEIAPGLFDTTDELDKILKPLWAENEHEYQTEELSNVLQIINKKLAFIEKKHSSKNETNLHEDLHYVILNILRAVGESYYPEHSIENVNNNSLLYNYMRTSTFSSEVINFIQDALQFHRSNFIKQQNIAIQNKNLHITELNNHITHLEQQITQQNTLINELNESAVFNDYKNTQLAQTITQQNTLIDEQNTENIELKNDIILLVKKIIQQNKLLEEQDNEIEELNQLVDTLEQTQEERFALVRNSNARIIEQLKDLAKQCEPDNNPTQDAKFEELKKSIDTVQQTQNNQNVFFRDNTARIIERFKTLATQCKTTDKSSSPSISSSKA